MCVCELRVRAGRPGRSRSRESPTADGWRHSAGCYRCLRASLAISVRLSAASFLLLLSAGKATATRQPSGKGREEKEKRNDDDGVPAKRRRRFILIIIDVVAIFPHRYFRLYVAMNIQVLYDMKSLCFFFCSTIDSFVTIISIIHYFII